MELFMPVKVFFEPLSLTYPLGQKLFDFFMSKGIETAKASLQNVYKSIPGSTGPQKYAQGKKTLVVAVKKESKLEVCRPSADFEFSLVTGCPGHCEYCYLQTTQGFRPYLKTYVNLEDIFDNIKKHITKNNNLSTTFEVASLGDPLSLEHLTGSLAKTIEFFGSLDNARLRVVTKYDNVDSLLHLAHNTHTRFRISVNSKYVINNFEHNTANFDERIEAASKIASAGYPVGFIVAPIMVYDNWKNEYLELFEKLKQKINLPNGTEQVTFELIQHRFTPTAKKFILERFPNTKLDMDEENRTLKWGAYGRFKYVYAKETSQDIKEYISSLITNRFQNAVIEYFT